MDIDTAPARFVGLMLDNPDEAAAHEAGYGICVVPAAALRAACGFTYECSHGHQHLVVSENPCVLEQQLTYWHEAHHCLCGMCGEWAGERRAERFARWGFALARGVGWS